MIFCPLLSDPAFDIRAPATSSIACLIFPASTVETRGLRSPSSLAAIWQVLEGCPSLYFMQRSVNALFSGPRLLGRGQSVCLLCKLRDSLF